MAKGPRGEKRPGDVIGAVFMLLFSWACATPASGKALSPVSRIMARCVAEATRSSPALSSEQDNRIAYCMRRHGYRNVDQGCPEAVDGGDRDLPTIQRRVRDPLCYAKRPSRRH